MKTTPYWWDDGAPCPDLPRTPPDNADVLIVGAGFTGLSAAIWASRGGAAVTVVDAGVPGEGASTRNGGMAGAHPRLSLSATAARWGHDTAVAMFNEAHAAYDHLAGLIDDFAIDCDYTLTGRIQLAWTAADFAAQKAMAADMARDTRFPVEVVERRNLGQHIATRRYFGGLYYPTHGALHPRKLHDGLMAAALDLGVTVVGNCPIWDIAPRGGGHEARHPGGTIIADKVILATNGYTSGGGVFRWLRRRVFPLPSFIVATEQLSPNLVAALAPGGRMMVETRARHSYFRVSPDGTRILWGGRASMTPISAETAAARLRSSIEDIWPDLKDVRLTHSWTGNTGFAFEQSPHVGVRDGVHFAMGYCGGGVVLAPYLGMKAAHQALGNHRGQTAYTATEFATRPWHPGGRPWFLYGANAWFTQVVDRRQNAAAARD
ncbi:MAG: FAD-binding oxidoreductase, partial [Pseudomonadota bacterium]